MDSKKVKMLSEYASFLESSLSKSGFNMSTCNILEVVSDDVNVTIGNEVNPKLRIINVSRLDDILRFPTLESDVDILYAQFPIKEVGYTLDNIAAIPEQTEISSILGAYGLNKMSNMKKHNLESIEKFRELLSHYGIDMEVFEEENKDSYFNLTVAKSKIKTR